MHAAAVPAAVLALALTWRPGPAARAGDALVTATVAGCARSASTCCSPVVFRVSELTELLAAGAARLRR